MKSKQGLLNISVALQRKVLPLAMLVVLSGCLGSSDDSNPPQEEVPVANELNEISPLSSHLQQLRSEYLEAVNSGTSFNVDSTGAAVVAGQDVILTITSTAQEVAALKNRLQQLGMTNISQYKHLLSGRFPIKRLAELNNVSGIRWVTSSQAQTHMTPGGSAYNAADTAQFSDVVRKQHNLDGSGVTIGVMSDSFDCLGGAADDVLSGDLPSDVGVIKEYSFCADDPRPDEGRAMMQLIHDIAPGAKLLFHTAWEGPIDFAAGIQRLADAGADIIVDDIGYLTMPMFQEGPIAQSVNEVQARGVSYFSAAGNSGRRSYESQFFGKQVEGSRDFAHDFGLAAGKSSDFYQTIIIPKDSTISISFQWDNPSEVANGKSGAESDIDIFLFDATKSTILARGLDSNIGHDPVEFISYTTDADSDSEIYYLYVSHRAGVEPTRLKYILYGPGLSDYEYAEELDLEKTADGYVFTEPKSGEAISEGGAVVVVPLGNFQFRIINISELVLSIDETIEGRPFVQQEGVIFLDDKPIWFVPTGQVPVVITNGELIVVPEQAEISWSHIGSYHTNSSTVFGHANAQGAIAVGAMSYKQTPWFNGNKKVEAFSSVGGTPILFDQQGNRLPAPEYRFKPEIVAVDDVNTTFFPLGDLADTDSDQDGFPNFSGTSAAAPNAAAVAALLLQQYTYLTPGQVRQVMMRGTIDLVDPAGLPGPQELLSNPCAEGVTFDWLTGCGLIQADLIFSAVDTSPELVQNTAGLKADFNNNGCVDSQDNTILLAVMRTSIDVQALYDLTGDGLVDAQDLSALQGMLGAGCLE